MRFVRSPGDIHCEPESGRRVHCGKISRRSCHSALRLFIDLLLSIRVLSHSLHCPVSSFRRFRLCLCLGLRLRIIYSPCDTFAEVNTTDSAQKRNTHSDQWPLRSMIVRTTPPCAFDSAMTNHAQPRMKSWECAEKVRHRSEHDETDRNEMKNNRR